jgi:hypothetical protein
MRAPFCDATISESTVVSQLRFVAFCSQKPVLCREQDRLKKEMMERVENVAAEFRKVAHSQMAVTTQRTIRQTFETEKSIF